MTQLIHTFTLIHEDGTQASASMPAVPGPDVSSGELQSSVDQLRDFSLQMGKAMEKRFEATGHRPQVTGNGKGHNKGKIQTGAAVK